ncbi:MAG TPA: aminotransferase class III-fold pyridoxal phosphate-dependent enzyme [Gemmatimonadales bacterium]|nr:aminotransferase class III-fold pyridoxal phosphate-dependent enzyme [Gemmatimonadales bacterium]
MASGSPGNQLDIWDVAWGNLDSLEWCFKEGGDMIAGVLLEPMRDHEPPPGYLHAVQDLCREHGALFIIDEIVTGFRWALGGATEYYGLTPDLACYSKALGNGYPVAAVVGRERHMRFADRVSSTFGGELVGLAAAGAVLGIYTREPVIEHLWKTGRQLMHTLGLVGFPVYPRFPENPRECADQLVTQGILIHPAKGTFCPTYSHSEADVKAVVNAVANPCAS